MSPQCGQTVLHVARIRRRKSTSFYMYPEVEQAQLLDTCRKCRALHVDSVESVLQHSSSQCWMKKVINKNTIYTFKDNSKTVADILFGTKRSANQTNRMESMGGAPVIASRHISKLNYAVKSWLTGIHCTFERLKVSDVHASSRVRQWT